MVLDDVLLGAWHLLISVIVAQNCFLETNDKGSFTDYEWKKSVVLTKIFPEVIGDRLRINAEIVAWITVYIRELDTVAKELETGSAKRERTKPAGTGASHISAERMDDSGSSLNVRRLNHSVVHMMLPIKRGLDGSGKHYQIS